MEQIEARPLNPTTTTTPPDSQASSGDWLDEWIRERVPRRFQAVTLEGYEPKNDKQREAVSAVEQWIDRALQGHGPMLALVGPQGTGKSHLLYGAAIRYARLVQRLRAKGPTDLHLPRLEPWYRLADVLRYSDERDSIRSRIYASRVVMIDEVRPTSGTNFDDTELAKFACHAYDEQTAVLITTNVHPLEKVMGPAAADRFAVQMVTGPSGR